MYYFFEMYFADNTFGSISPQNPHIFVITVQRTHPRMYGGRSDDSFPTILTHTVHPRVHGARMHQHLLQNHLGMAHPRVYGADTKFLKRIPVISKPFFYLGLPQQNQYASFWPSIFLRITLFGQYWPEMIHILVIAVW